MKIDLCRVGLPMVLVIILAISAFSCSTLGTSSSGLALGLRDLLSSERSDSETDAVSSDGPHQTDAAPDEDQEAKAALETTQSRSDESTDSHFAWDLQKLDTARNVSYMSEMEKNVVLELNKVRSNPKMYAEEYIEPRRRHFRGTLYEQPGQITLLTREGVRALDECVEALKKARPVGLLGPASGLTSAARDHAKDQEKTGRTGHTGSDGSSMEQRISRYGEWDKLIGENISYGNGEARDIVIQLLIDDGIPSRGHRQNIMKSQFASIGTAIAGHPDYGFVCVMDFAGEYTDRK